MVQLRDSTARSLSEAALLVEEAEQKVREGETERRKLHNTIQELKGNIRVFCRVRPPNGELASLAYLIHVKR